MWKLTLLSRVPYPTTSSEPVTLTVSTKSASLIVNRAEKVSGPDWPYRTSYVVRDGVYYTCMVVTMPDSVKPSDIVLLDTHARFTARAGQQFWAGDVTTVHVSWAVVVAGKEWWCFPNWLSESDEPTYVPSHLLEWANLVGPDWYPAYTLGSIGTFKYYAGGMPSQPMSGALSGVVGFNQHSNASADIFVPSGTTRQLVVQRPVVEVPTPVVVAPTVPNTTDTVSRADLAKIEARLVDVQNAIGNVAKAMDRLCSSQEFQDGMMRRASENRAVNGSVAAVGNYVQSEFSNIPTRKQRVMETLLLTGVTSVLGEVIAGK